MKRTNCISQQLRTAFVAVVCLMAIMFSANDVQAQSIYVGGNDGKPTTTRATIQQTPVTRSNVGKPKPPIKKSTSKSGSSYFSLAWFYEWFDGVFDVEFMEVDPIHEEEDNGGG